MPSLTLRTDLNIAQLPSVLPNVGGLLGKNIVYTDPDFHTRVVRLTDGSSGSGNNGTMQTNAASVRGGFNTDDSLLAFQNTGGVTYFFQFNRDTMQGEQIAALKLAGNGCFSSTSAGVYYVLLDNNHVFDTVTGNGTAVYKVQFVKTKGAWVYQKISKVCDFLAILPVGFSVNWQSEVEVSLGDGVFSCAFSEGNQDTGFLACLYKAGLLGGYRMINTQTLDVTGHWGKVGKAVLRNTKYTNFLLHGMDQTPNPEYTILSAVGNTTGGFIWENSGLTLTQPGISGHHGVGYENIFLPKGPGGQFYKAAYAAPTTNTAVVPEAGLPANQNPAQVMVGDEHCAFSPVNKTDASILWATYGPPCPSPFTSCWMGEVTGVDVTTGVVYRACHTFNSGNSPQYEITASMVSTSQTGNFIAFSSDFMGTLGVDTNGVARGDVFIVRIK